MSKVKIDYVFSGTNLLRLRPNLTDYTDEKYKEHRYNLITECFEFIRNSLNSKLDNVEVDFNMLYNAFTENHMGEFHVKQNYGFKKTYSDSGGLQIITQQKKMTDKIKGKIYESQNNYSDFAFCFDEIPVESVGDGIIDRNTTNSKVFNQNRIKETAQKTAMNIKEQLKVLTKPSIFYIIQGNTYDDMLKWFNYGKEILGDDIEKLEGIALAGICIGNGELEICDMMYGAYKIFESEPRLKKKIHLLGVGTTKRILPSILLKKSGLLGDIEISADSSTCSLVYMMGKNVSMDGKPTTLMETYINFCTEMKPVLEKYCDGYDALEFAKLINDNNKSTGDIEKLCHDDKNHKYHKIGLVVCPCLNIWSLGKMFYGVERELKDNTPMTELLDVKTGDDYLLWRSRNFSKIESNRLPRMRKGIF